MIFSGPSYRTICQADGRWSHPVPRCYGELVVVNKRDLGPVGLVKPIKRTEIFLLYWKYFNYLTVAPPDLI